jgi:hypothetical protein
MFMVDNSLNLLYRLIMVKGGAVVKYRKNKKGDLIVTVRYVGQTLQGLCKCTLFLRTSDQMKTLADYMDYVECEE